MRNFLFLILIILLANCGASSYTSSEFFDSKLTSDFNLDSDKKQLIFTILSRAVVEKKDIPDYNLIKDKKRFYIVDVHYPKFVDTIMPKSYPINPSDIPMRIGDIEFCVKSKTEIQNIADKTDDFMYLTFGKIEIRGNYAKIGLDNGWVVSKKNKGKYVIMSGGGYELHFEKINGQWRFDKVYSHWQS